MRNWVIFTVLLAVPAASQEIRLDSYAAFRYTGHATYQMTVRTNELAKAECGTLLGPGQCDPMIWLYLVRIRQGFAVTFQIARIPDVAGRTHTITVNVPSDTLPTDWIGLEYNAKVTSRDDCEFQDHPQVHSCIQEFGEDSWLCLPYKATNCKPATFQPGNRRPILWDGWKYDGTPPENCVVCGTLPGRNRRVGRP